MIIKRLMQSIREYKKDSILAPLYVSCEVVLEVIIPFLTAALIDKGIDAGDMNYVVNHYGKKSECKMSVKGTLKDSSQKTYRGTIDFKNGCSGAIGDEQEDTLLLSPTVVNKSLPVILCDEEDVSGEHGATIGRLSEEVLFYMKSRGIAKNVAENIIARAKIQSVVSLIPDEQTVELIQKYMDGVFGDE